MRQSVRTYILVGLLFLFLVAIRAFENVLFYDPFTAYFEGNFLKKNYPDFNGLHLFLSLLFRYALNAVISLGVLYLLFRNKAYTKVSLYIFIGAFVLLCPVYFVLLSGSSDNYLLTFYIRRFLIHPVFVLILIPAFYYQQKKQKVA
ncbi:exosortase F system-associated membrane protein [Neptunitalea lumnitzerae]|uniref:exosortase F system-associated membrane protein n=1 Tax=Neptunitalea lumnitzerae TaxID=2965509 RepID=UPI0024934DC1|nr:exosortase F system-associated protein [Neptunitalea sp. Y10]